MITIEVNRIEGQNALHIKVTSDLIPKDLYIDTQRTFNCGETESNDAFHLEISPDESVFEDNIYIFERDIYLDNIMPSIDRNALVNSNVESDLYFIYVITEQLYSKKEIFYDADVLKKLIFENIYNDISSRKCCEVNLNSANLVLLYYGFNLAELDRDKVRFWNMMHLNTESNNSSCSCNG